MPPVARRVYRLTLSVTLSLAIAYGFAVPLPYLAPLFALMLTVASPGPFGLKSAVGMIVLVLVTTGLGLLLVPVLLNYPSSGLLIIALGIFLSNYISLSLKKGAVGTFLIVGLTMITAAGVASFELALLVVKALVMGIGLAVICQRLVFVLIPEPVVADPAPPAPTAEEDSTPSNWAALRASIIVFPAYVVALVNPSMYMPLIMKSVSLGQQGSLVDFKSAGKELIGSTFFGGCFAVLFWVVLKIHPTLWMFTLWMALFGFFFASSLYHVIKNRYSPSFWMNVVVTMLILLGPAVSDSASGDDVYTVFAVRLTLFFAVTFYAWGAIYVLEIIRDRQLRKTSLLVPK